MTVKDMSQDENLIKTDVYSRRYLSPSLYSHWIKTMGALRLSELAMRSDRSSPRASTEATNGEETLLFQNAGDPPTDPRSQIKGGRSSGRARGRRVRGESRGAGVKNSENKQHNTAGQTEQLEERAGLQLTQTSVATRTMMFVQSSAVCK